MADIKTPSKRWRVISSGVVTDYRSENAAYEVVRDLAKAAARVRVEHWEDGHWRLYERIKPGEDGW